MGLSLEYFKNIPGIELRQMTNEELKIVLQNVAMHTNARLSQIKRADLLGISKSAYNLTKNYPKGLSSKGAKRGDLLKQIKAGQRFLKGKTSTVSGTRKMMKKMLNIAGIEEGETKEDTKSTYENIYGHDFWEIYRKLLEENKSFKDDSDKLIQAVVDIYEDYKGSENDKKSKESYITDMVQKARDHYNNIYGAGVSFASDEDLANKYKRR